ncbi:MAG TPA: hypothetical protein VKB38_02625 [Terracidiphilus sp.]|nr:hypothetical protein [Terracidiphilus sp.]
MNFRVGIAVLSGLVIAVLAWVFAFRGASWAAPITEPMFLLGNLVVLALTPARQSPDLVVILLGYVVNFVFTWTIMALAVGFILRLIAKGRMSA